MPYSYKKYKDDIKNWVYSNFDKNAKILDVGPGSGTYWDLLNKKFKNIECVEIFKPYVKRFALDKKYKNVNICDICDFKYENFDLIIFGDIIEHLEVSDAQRVLEYAYTRCKNFIVAVPYLYEQGEYQGNTHEVHKQPDLTPEIVLERYPYLQLLYGDEMYGYYIKNVDYVDKEGHENS